MNSFPGGESRPSFDLRSDPVDEDVGNFDSEYTASCLGTHTSGPCPSSVEKELEWFLNKRIPEAFNDLKDLLDISLKYCEETPQNDCAPLIPSSRGK